jgi:hypothetical protein
VGGVRFKKEGGGLSVVENNRGWGENFISRYRLSGLVCIGLYLLLPAGLGYRGWVGLRVYPIPQQLLSLGQHRKDCNYRLHHSSLFSNMCYIQPIDKSRSLLEGL